MVPPQHLAEMTAPVTSRVAPTPRGSFDYLEFYVDGGVLNSWSGVGGVAAPESFPIATGNHTLEWRFIKDGSVTSGSDTVWVDDIVLFGGVPI